MIDKSSHLDPPHIFEFLKRPVLTKKNHSNYPRDKVKEALSHVQETSAFNYIVQNSGLSKYRVLRICLVPLYKKSLSELYYLEIIAPRFDDKVRKKIQNVQKKPEVFRMISERKKDSSSSPFSSLDERSFLLLKDTKLIDQDIESPFESNHVFYRSMQEFKSDITLKLFGDAKFQQALLPNGSEVNYFFELTQNDNLIFLCCNPPQFSDILPVLKNNNNPHLSYDSKKDVYEVKSLAEWGKAAKLNTLNPSYLYIELLLSLLGEGRIQLKPFVMDEKAIQIQARASKTHIFTLDSIKPAKAVFRKEVTEQVSFQTLDATQEVLDTEELATSGPSIPDSLKLSHQIRPLIKLKQNEKKRKINVSRKSAALLKEVMVPQVKATKHEGRQSSLPSRDVLIANKIQSNEASQNTSIQVQGGGQNSRLISVSRIGSLPKLEHRKLSNYGEGGSNGRRSHKEIFTPLKRDKRYNLKQTIEYFSKCGDSVQRRAVQDLEAEPTLGSLRCIPRVKEDPSILDLSQWKPSFSEMRKSLASSQHRFQPAGPGITLSQRLPGISKNQEKGPTKKKKNHKSTLSLVSDHSRSQSITSLQANIEELHFFYRPIPTLKKSVLLKLQPSLAYYMETLNYDVDVIEKCLREFFLLLQVQKEGQSDQCDLFPRLIRIKVPTKKYFQFLSRSQALQSPLRIETVHSFFQNLKTKSLTLFRACLQAIEVPLLDFGGFMRVRYFFIEKRARPNQIIEFVTEVRLSYNQLLTSLLEREEGFDLLKHKSLREESLDEFTIPSKMVYFLDSVKHDDFFDNEGRLSNVGFRRKCKTGELDALSFLTALY